MRIKRSIIIMIISAIILVPVLIYYMGKAYFTVKQIYSINWNIEIPSDFIEIYNNKGPRGFQGDGLRYTIFETRYNDILSVMNFDNSSKEMQIQVGNSNDGRNKDIEEFVFKIAEKIGVSQIYHPSFDHRYIWKKLSKQDMDTLIILYFPDSNRIYFVEELI